MDGGGGYSARNGARDAPVNRPASTGSTLGVVNLLVGVINLFLIIAMFQIGRFSDVM